MNGLCLWVRRGAMSAATERSSSTQRHWNDENRLNRVLSPFCGQQEISDSRDYGSSVIVGCSFFRRGLRRNGSGLLPLAPHPPPCKTGFMVCKHLAAFIRRRPPFWGWREILAASFSGYFFNDQLFFKS